MSKRGAGHGLRDSLTPSRFHSETESMTKRHSADEATGKLAPTPFASPLRFQAQPFGGDFVALCGVEAPAAPHLVTLVTLVTRVYSSILESLERSGRGQSASCSSASLPAKP